MMELKEIKYKSISGLKWTVFISIIALPIGYMTNIILGRISPEALGVYGLLNIFIVSVTTFILFGGGNVITKYLPEVEKNKKANFLISYICIVFIIAIFAIVLIHLYPQILKFIFGLAFPSDMLSYLFIFMPVVILYSVFDFALNGLMEIKASVIIRKSTTFGYFIVFSILFLLYKDFFREHIWVIIWGLSFVFYIILGLLALFIIIKRIKVKASNNNISNNYTCKHSDRDNLEEVYSQELYWKSRILSKLRNLKLYLPPKFWSFTLFVHISTILVFAYDMLDQLFILKYFDIRELGLYYAALKTAMLIRFVPMLLGSVLLPTFSSLFAANETGLIQKGYREAIRYNTLMIVPTALICIFFSRQIMGLFGGEYVQNHLVVAVLGSCSMVSSIGSVAPSLIIAKGKAGANFLNSAIQIAFQFFLMFFLIDKLGVLGLAIGRGAGVVLAQFGLIFITYKLIDIEIRIPKAYISSVFIAFVALSLYLAIQPTNIIISAVLFSGCLVFFLCFGGYSIKDVDFILRKIGKETK